MFTVAVIIHIIVCVVIVVAVLLQSGKGSSLGSGIGGGTAGQALFGSAGPATLLTKVTAGAAIVFMITSLYMTYASARKGEDSIMSDMPTVTEPVAPATTDTAPAVAPAAVPAPGAAEKK